jgi:predicted GH43/DUF377 family glycosyl hydrolase
MKWKKKGLVYEPTSEMWWAKSGAQLPTVDILSDEVIRVYFTCKDLSGYGRIGYVDLDADNPKHILEVARDPVLEPGDLGTFDDCGCAPSCVIQFQGRRYFYYQGFQQTKRVPYMTFTGLAIGSSNTGPFEKASRVPVMDRSDKEPFVRSTSCILIEGNLLRMWYVSTLKWVQDGKGIHYICAIRYAESYDAINWHSYEQVCLEPDLPDEYAVGRPSVIHDNGIYKMWYSIRSFSKLYSIGYAESEDGISWTRRDEEAGIEKSVDGWDSEMICYPCVADVNGARYMFYNGNGRGISGFGYAVLEP